MVSLTSGSFGVVLGLEKLNSGVLLTGKVGGLAESKTLAGGFPVVESIALFESAFSVEAAGVLKAGADEVVVGGKLGNLNRGVEEGAVAGAPNAGADEEVA